MYFAAPPIVRAHLRYLEANVIIDSNGHACLADFSLITLIPDQTTFVSSCVQGGTLAWMSPELLDPQNLGPGKTRRRSTRQSDCYALGMVIYEILSGHVPFEGCGPCAALAKVLGGERPERPQGEERKLFTDGVWSVVECCWKQSPGDRPSAKGVLRCLEGEGTSSHSYFPEMEVDAEPDSDDQSDATSSTSTY